MHDIFFPLINGFSLFLKASKIFRSILEMLGNLKVICKSLMKNWESSEVFGLVNIVSSLTADHYFWCSGGVPCCFEGVPGYYGMFQGCSGVVPGCSGLFRGCSREVSGCSGGVPGCSGFYRHPSASVCGRLNNLRVINFN